MRLLLLLALALPAAAQTNINSAGTSVIGSPAAGGSATVTASSVASAVAAQTGCTTAGYVWVPASNSCVAAPTAPAATATTPGSITLPKGYSATQLSPVALMFSADNAASGAGGNGLANLLSGPCFGACDAVVSSAYSMTEYSRFFSPAFGSAVLYKQAPFAGGFAVARLVEDHRGGNRYWTSRNNLPVACDALNCQRFPFVFDSVTTSARSYADNNGVLAINQDISGAGTNYLAHKFNFGGLRIATDVRSSGQGGSIIESVLSHPAPGDDMVFSIQHMLNGCSESEDECTKLFRAFLHTLTARFGGTLNAAPTPDAAGFGNYALDVTVGSGYDATKSGEGVFLVNLQSPYTTGNATEIKPSPYAGSALVTGDTAAAWYSRFGASAITPLTAPIDEVTYNASCPSTVTNSAVQVPSPMTTDENGVGGVTGFCASVTSTANITAGQACTLAGVHSNIEMVKVVSNVDATHLRLNVQMPHPTGDILYCGGAQGQGFSFVADDIAPGGLGPYALPITTTLHKFFPVLGSDANGLYLYTNEAAVAELSTAAYLSTTPLRNAVLGSPAVTLSGTSVTSVNLSDTGSYGVDTSVGSSYNYAGIGAQAVLAAPTVIFSGSCTTLPVAKGRLFYAGNVWQLAIDMASYGNCSAPPTVTLQTTWPNPYRLAPLAVTKKVINPATGKISDGHLLVGAINPANWHAGDAVEIPGWIHDRTGSMKIFGKYYTGASRGFGIVDQTIFQGNYAGGDTLIGIANQTDGHKYFASASVPLGPGVAYEPPPNGYGMAGNFNVHLPLYAPPSTAVIDIGCDPFGGYMSYHPCVDGIPTAYNLFQMRSTPGEVGTRLRYDPTLSGPLAGLLSWTNAFGARTLLTTRGTPASASEACATGETWADANWVYHCTATNTIKTAPLTAFQTASGGGTALAIGSVTLSGGVGSRTFTTAFPSAPRCTLTDSTTTALATYTATTTAIAVTGNATDSVSFICGVAN